VLALAWAGLWCTGGASPHADARVAAAGPTLITNEGPRVRALNTPCPRGPGRPRGPQGQRSTGSSTRCCAALCLLGKQQLDGRNRRLIDAVPGLDVGLHLHGLPSFAFEPLSLWGE
jgi:hypothetical protein